MLDSAFVAYRDGNGEAEIHEKLADLLLIRSGEGVVLVGGKIVEGKPSGTDEIRGKSIEGGANIPSRPATSSIYRPTPCTSSSSSRERASRRWW
jgi:hypothetical protein